MPTIHPAADDKTILAELAPVRRRAVDQLVRLRRIVRFQQLTEGLCWTTAGLVALAAGSLVLDRWLQFGLAVRIALLAIAIVTLGAIAVRCLLIPLATRFDTLDLAWVLDRFRPGTGQQIATVIQLPDVLLACDGTSASMVQAAVLSDSEQLDTADLAGFADRQRRTRFLFGLATALVIPVVFALAWPETAGIWARRWLLGAEIHWPHKTTLVLAGLSGDAMFVPRGEPITLHVAASPSTAVPSVITIRYRYGNDTRRARFDQFGPNDFRFELEPLAEPTRATIQGGDDWIGPIRLQPIDRPTIVQLILQSRAPGAAPDQREQTSADQPDLQFLRRTELELHLTSRVSLASASLVGRSGAAPPFEQLDDRRYVARWTLTEPLAMEINLIGSEGNLDSHPHALSIGIRKDRAPRVMIRTSGLGPRVSPMVRVPVDFHADDDFGLRSLRVALECERVVEKANECVSHDIALEAAAEPARECDRSTSLALADYRAMPGTTVRLRGVAGDNCVDGTQLGESRALTFRVVTAEELLHEILLRQRAERAKFKLALDQAKEQVEPLEQLAEPQQAGSIVRRHAIVARQVGQVANRLADSHTELDLNGIADAQTLRLLLVNVIEPMRRLQTASLPAQGARLARLSNADAIAELGPQARTEQRAIVAAMQKIMDQMVQWESFVDAVNQLKEILRLQQQVLRSTEELKRAKSRSVFDK